MKRWSVTNRQTKGQIGANSEKVNGHMVKFISPWFSVFELYSFPLPKIYIIKESSVIVTGGWICFSWSLFSVTSRIYSTTEIVIMLTKWMWQQPTRGLPTLSYQTWGKSCWKSHIVEIFSEPEIFEAFSNVDFDFPSYSFALTFCVIARNRGKKIWTCSKFQ